MRENSLSRCVFSLAAINKRMSETKRLSAFVLVCCLVQAGLLHAGFGAQEQILPQVVFGNIARTLISIHNPGEATATVSVQIYRTAGGGLFSELDVALLARETRTLELGEGQEELVVGFARLTSDLPVTATALFQFVDRGTLLGEAGVLPQAQVEEFQVFAFLNSRTGTKTGVALVNDGETSVDVTARQLRNGQIVATSLFTLASKEHRANFLDEEPYFPGLDDYEDTVEFVATGPVSPLALRQDGFLTTTISVSTPETRTVVPGAIGTEELADGAVTSEKIAAGAVGSRELADQIEVQTLGILDSSGVELLGLHSTDAGSGFFTTRSRTGARLVEISDATSLDPDRLGEDQWGAITTFDSSGQQLVRLSRWSDDGEKFGFIASRNQAGMDMMRLRGDTGSGGSFGVLESFDAAGHRLVTLSRTGGQFGFVATKNPAGIDLVRLTANSELGHGIVETRDSDGQTMVRITRTDTGAGLVQTRNAAGTTIVRLSSSTSGGMTSGFVSVRDATGTQTAGINGRTGTVFGNTKSFIVRDPTHPARNIRYTSLEGPEAAIYVRGTAELLDGQAAVEFPDHFVALGVASSITVTLTPRSADSLGLAVVEVSGEGFQVRELLRGQGGYPFDYVAQAVRKGYEDYEVYIDEGRSATEVEAKADREDRSGGDEKTSGWKDDSL